MPEEKNPIPRVLLRGDGTPENPDVMRRFIDIVRQRLNGVLTAGPDYSPPLSDFTIPLNFGSRGSWSVSDGHAYLKDSGPASPGDNLISRVKAAPSAFTLTVAFRPHHIPGVVAFFGLVMRDSATGRMMGFLVSTRVSSNPFDVLLVQYSAPTVGVSAVANQPWIATRQDVRYLRIVKDATNYTYYVSVDFINWMPFFQEPLAGHYVANVDQAGYVLTWNSGGPPLGSAISSTFTAMEVLSCTLTTP